MEDNILLEAVTRILKAATTKQAKVCASFTPGDLVEITQKGVTKFATVVLTANEGTAQSPNWAIHYKDETGKLAEWKQADGGTVKLAGLWKNLMVTLGVLGSMVGVGVAGYQYDQQQAKQIIQQVNQKLDEKAKELVSAYNNASTPEAKRQIRSQVESEISRLKAHQESTREIEDRWQAAAKREGRGYDSTGTLIAYEISQTLQASIEVQLHALKQFDRRLE